MIKMATIVYASPCGGKTTVKEHLEGYNVVCVDMSDLIKSAASNDLALKAESEKLALSQQLLPCDTTMKIFTDFLTENQSDRMVFFGVPRTDFQAEFIANHNLLAGFDVLRFLDISVDISIIEQRYLKRQAQGIRSDDRVPWSAFKENRVDPFLESRHSLLKVFNSHARWNVSCICGDAPNAASTVANQIAANMRLRKLQAV